MSEVDIKNISLEGSLRIEAQDALGRVDATGCIEYSNETGKCTLHNVIVKNRGIDRSADNQYWSGQIERSESFHVILHGNAEFYAKDVVFAGDMCIEVPDGYQYIASEKNGSVEFDKIKIDRPSWSWKYTAGPDDILLTR